MDALEQLLTYMVCDDESTEVAPRGILVCIVPHILYILWVTPRFVSLVHYVEGGGVNSLCPAVPLYKETAKTNPVSGHKI